MLLLLFMFSCVLASIMCAFEFYVSGWLSALIFESTSSFRLPGWDVPCVRCVRREGA